MRDPKQMVAGFNHNVKYGGKAYHVQTEDSGVTNPRIVTHLFLGGNILATKRTGYDELTGAAELDRLVREIMEEQHKEMLRGLVAGIYEDAPAGEAAAAPGRAAAPANPAPAGRTAPPLPPSAAAPRAQARDVPPPQPSLPASAAPTAPVAPPQPAAPARSGAQLPHIAALPTPVPTDAEPVPLSLDDVILSYLAEDLGQKKG